jgi:hypothetical protein
MTLKQNSLYWREWGALVRHCKAASLPAPDRHDLHMAALGEDKSHLAFSNEDFDQVLGVFRAHSRPADIGSQLRQIEQPRIRLKYAIRALAPATSYWSKISRDRFGTDALSVEQLTQLRNTLKERRRARMLRSHPGREPGDSTTLSANRSLRGAGPEMVAVEPVSGCT